MEARTKRNAFHRRQFVRLAVTPQHVSFPQDFQNAPMLCIGLLNDGEPSTKSDRKGPIAEPNRVNVRVRYREHKPKYTEHTHLGRVWRMVAHVKHSFEAPDRSGDQSSPPGGVRKGMRFPEEFFRSP